MAKSEGISGIAVTAIVAGGILAWSAIRGWTVSGVMRDIISGKDPRQDAALQNSLAVSAGGLVNEAFGSIINQLNPFKGTSSNSSGNVVTVSDVSSGFTNAFLTALGAPLTQANINSVNAWVHHEGGGGANNPLNTTISMPGASNFNSVGVKNFISLAQGVEAAAKTVLGGRYGDIVMALRSGQGLCGRSWSGLSTWSGGGYSSVC